MSRFFTALLFLFFCLPALSQHIIVFKKGRKEIKRYWEGMTIAFDMHRDDWRKGTITKITNDSVYIQPVIVRYSLMTTDTVRLGISGYRISDIRAMPNAGILIDYKNGLFHISRTGGHMHFYWVKSGWLFRILGGGYAGLEVINGLTKDNYTFKKSRLGYAAGVFGLGVLLKIHYKPYIKLGKRNRLQVLSL